MRRKTQLAKSGQRKQAAASILTNGKARRAFLFAKKRQKVMQCCIFSQKYGKSKDLPRRGRGTRTRTLGTWFWRPMLYQLSYTPIFRYQTIILNCYLLVKVFIQYFLQLFPFKHSLN